jgi:Cell division protein FtsQ
VTGSGPSGDRLLKAGGEPAGMWLVAAAGAKKKRTKSGSGWSWRLAGIALCAFFALGVVTGLSQPGRLLARRIESLLHCLPHTGRSELIPAAYRGLFVKESTFENRQPSSPSPSHAIALAERQDGFYQVDSEGFLLGPVPSVDAPDLPILSGAGIEHASTEQLLEYAGELIRAEAALGAVISEMRVTARSELHLYLDQPHVVIVLTSAGLPLQLARVAKVLSIWRAHGSLIEMIDMTVPDEAIVRTQAEGLEHPDFANTDRAIRSFKLVAPLQDRSILSEAAVTH